MGVIAISVRHALKLGATPGQIMELIQELEAEIGVVLESAEQPIGVTTKNVAKENQLVSQGIGRNVDSLVHESISTSDSSALVTLVDSRALVDSKPTPKKRKRKLDSAEFNQFWAIFPRREGKGAARKSWDKATLLATIPEIMEGAKKYAEVAKTKEKQYICMASTWLNQERWTDEHETRKPAYSRHCPQRTFAEIQAEKRAKDALVCGDDQGQERRTGTKEPQMARLSDFLPTLHPLDNTQENQATMLAQSLPDEVSVCGDEWGEPPPFDL